MVSPRSRTAWIHASEFGAHGLDLDAEVAEVVATSKTLDPLPFGSWHRSWVARRGDGTPVRVEMRRVGAPGFTASDAADWYARLSRRRPLPGLLAVEEVRWVHDWLVVERRHPPGQDLARLLEAYSGPDLLDPPAGAELAWRAMEGMAEALSTLIGEQWPIGRIGLDSLWCELGPSGSPEMCWWNASWWGGLDPDPGCLDVHGVGQTICTILDAGGWEHSPARPGRTGSREVQVPDLRQDLKRWTDRWSGRPVPLVSGEKAVEDLHGLLCRGAYWATVASLLRRDPLPSQVPKIAQSLLSSLGSKENRSPGPPAVRYWCESVLHPEDGTFSDPEHALTVLLDLLANSEPDSSA